MNILHLGCPYYPYNGGSTVRLHSLVTSYSDNDDVSLYLATPSLSSSDADNFPFKGVYRNPKLNQLVFSATLLNFLRKNVPDVVVIHNSRALAKWVFWYKVFFKSSIIVEIHSFREESTVKKLFNRFLYRFVDHFVVMSQASAGWLFDKHGLRNASIVYNGADLTSGFRQAVSSSQVVFAYIGSFHEWQGVLLLAEAARSMGADFWQNNRLLLIGGGPDFEETKLVIGDELLRQGNIELVGWQSKAEVINRLQGVDYLLAPRPSTIATETVVPLKVLESMAYRIPLIISPVGGLTELLDDTCAIVMKENNVTGLKDALVRASRKERYFAMQEELEKRLENVDNWRASGEKYMKLFKRVCAR